MRQVYVLNFFRYFILTFENDDYYVVFIRVSLLDKNLVEAWFVLLEVAGDAVCCIASYTFEVRKTADDFQHLFIFALLLFHQDKVVVLWIEVGQLTQFGLDTDSALSVLLLIIVARLAKGVA